MLDNALVSAIIVTYNRPIEILKRAVQSVLNQTYDNIEIIVVNDYPDDKNLVKKIQEMLKDLDKEKIEYIVHENNQGACAARNTGIKASKGEYIALLDDDDEWLPEKIAHQILGFKSKKIGLVYSPFYNITDNLPGKLCIRGTKSGKLTEDLLWTNCIGGTSMPLIRKEVFETCGLFDEKLLSSQDYDMWLRISQKYEIECVNEPLIRRYMQEESITRNFKKQKQGFELFNEKYAVLYKNNPKALNYRLNRRTNKWLEQGHIKEACKVYKEAIKIKFFSIYNIIEPCKGIIKYMKAGIKK